jgi:hypothetical protein
MGNKFEEEFGVTPYDVTICASMAHQSDWLDIADNLRSRGLSVAIPEISEPVAWADLSDDDVAARKGRFVRQHLALISASRSILVCNYAKNEIDNYVGANTLMEMTAAYIWNIPIFLLNGTPMTSNRDEVLAMRPVFLHGNIDTLSLSLQDDASIKTLAPELQQTAQGGL